MNRGLAPGLAEAILERLDAAVLVLDAELRCVFANDPARRLFALPVAAAAPVPVPALQRLPDLLARLRAFRARPEPARFPLDLPDASRLEAALSPWFGGGAILILRDVTAARRLETARRDFTAALSHELRTPLTSIEGYVELLEDLPPGDPAAAPDYLAAIRRNTARLGRLTRDLVLLSSVETGGYPFHPEAVSAPEAVAHVVETLAPLAAERGARLAAAAVASARVRADRDILHRVLLNLAENALLHAGDSGLLVELSGAPAPQGEAAYVFAVRDNGRGIAAADQPRVFERFFRVDRGHAHGPNPGTGLGLALVKHLVREQGGRVELESALGRGSTFRVFWPLAPEPPL